MVIDGRVKSTDRPARQRWSLVRIALAVPLVLIALTVSGVRPASIALVYLAAVTPALVHIDARTHRLPNAIVLPGQVLGLVCCGVEALTGAAPTFPLLAAAGYSAFLLVLHLTGGMGMGDVKLGALLGLCSWSPFVAVGAPVLAFLSGGVASAVLLLREGRGARMAFGPYLLAGFWAALALSRWSGGVSPAGSW